MSFAQFLQILIQEINEPLPLLNVLYLIGVICFVFPSIFIVFPDDRPPSHLVHWIIMLILGFTSYISLMAGHPWLGLVFLYDILLWIVLYIIESNNKPQKQLRGIIINNGGNIKFKSNEEKKA